MLRAFGPLCGVASSMHVAPLRHRGVTVVIGSDLIYGTLTAEEVAAAVCAALLPRGGLALLMQPVHHRKGMFTEDALVGALESAGLQVKSANVVDDGGAHYAFSACEDGQVYVLHEAVALSEQPMDVT
eukprot:TRINITY_DN36343_c0_g1_i1.p1 TRINITY_DN36343_c0_g1~~TRINITY_DN36343_c0_g1_i1.p1  ORF type:complete len:128 (+),score=22.64 TRINITY_DN36343_c0_g1_i1:51-434(+)